MDFQDVFLRKFRIFEVTAFWIFCSLIYSFTISIHDSNKSSFILLLRVLNMF